MKTKLFAIVAVCASMIGCGERVEVGVGYVGKTLAPSGLQEGIHSPSTFRLPYTAPWSAPYRLVLCEVSDQAKQEEIRVFMEKDKLNLDFDLRMILSIPAEGKYFEQMFARLPAAETKNDRVRMLDFDQAYQVYGVQVVREVARSVVAKYSISQIMESREKVGQEIETGIRNALKDTPIQVLSAGFGDIQPPAVIVKAQEAAKEREVEIQRAEAQRLVEMTEADTRVQVAKKNQEVVILTAEAEAEANRILAASVTPEFVQQRTLLVMGELARSGNTKWIIPDSALRNPAIMLGVMQQITQDDKNGK